MRKVTSFDVAREAGVSQPTVSRALRGMPGISPGTRRRVEEAAQRLEYVASDRGRVLSTARTRRVAVISEELSNPFYPELVEPIRRALASQGLRTVVLVDSDRESLDLGLLADGSYDGAILTTTRRNSPLPQELRGRRIPHVLVNRVTDEQGSHRCAVDNAGGVRAAAELLMSLGHRLVGAIQGPLAMSTSYQRHHALLEAVHSLPLVLSPAHVRFTEFSHDAGHAAAHDLLARADRPTAVVSGNDVIALGVLSAARELGLRVPDDLTVIGFDDIRMAAWPLIGLTTVRADLEAMAHSAVELLMEEMRQPAPRPHILTTPTRLVLRSTHAPAPS